MYMDLSFMQSVLIRKETRILAAYFQAVNDCFYENYMILNTRKYYYMCMGKAVGENFEQTKTN